jgi:hypothetical protein
MRAADATGNRTSPLNHALASATPPRCTSMLRTIREDSSMDPIAALATVLETSIAA